VIKCNVCGSENEAAALFCGTCGSPLNPADAKAIVEEATKPEPASATPDDTVVPGQGAGARRDLGTGAPQDQTGAVPTGVSTDTMAIRDDIAAGKPTITCSVCGTINEATRTYCRKCANELKPAAPPPPPPPVAATPRRISPVAIGLGAAAVVVAIALIGVLAFGGGPAATTKPSARASQPASSGQATGGASAAPTAAAPTFAETKVGGLVAFARCPQGGKGTCTLFTIKADGSARSVQITSDSAGSAFDPSLSWDRTKVIFSVSTGLKIVTVKTKSWVQHSTGAGDSGAAFSPDGKQIIFSGFRTRDNQGTDPEIRIDGVSSSVSSSTLTNNDVPDTQPVWSKDGKTIFFIEGDGTSAELMSLDIASKSATQITTDQFEDRDPAVSPDGKYIAFASTRAGKGFDLYLYDTTTKLIWALPTMDGDERHPAWSPDSTHLVFSGGTKGSEDLFILDLHDNSVSNLTTGPSADISPTWH
jgi:hypothetical protein